MQTKVQIRVGLADVVTLYPLNDGEIQVNLNDGSELVIEGQLAEKIVAAAVKDFSESRRNSVNQVKDHLLGITTSILSPLFDGKKLGDIKTVVGTIGPRLKSFLEEEGYD